jgi:hypothetical protein
MTKNKTIDKILNLTKPSNTQTALDYLSDQSETYLEKYLKVCQYLKKMK